MPVGDTGVGMSVVPEVVGGVGHSVRGGGVGVSVVGGRGAGVGRLVGCSVRGGGVGASVGKIYAAKALKPTALPFGFVPGGQFQN